MATLSVNTEPQTRFGIFGDGPQLFRRNSIPFLAQRLLQPIQTFVALSTGPNLQNWPNIVIHRVAIRRLRRSFHKCDEGWKMDINHS